MVVPRRVLLVLQGHHVYSLGDEMYRWDLAMPMLAHIRRIPVHIRKSRHVCTGTGCGSEGGATPESANERQRLKQLQEWGGGGGHGYGAEF